MALDAFLADYAQHAEKLPGAQLSWLQQRRTRALARFKQAGIPSTALEAWKYTRLRPLERSQFAYVAEAGQVDTAALEPWWSLAAHGYRVVLVDGQFDAALSALEGVPAGVQLQPLSQALQTEAADQQGGLQASLGQWAAEQEAEQAGLALSLLNDAMAADGLLLSIGPQVALDKPLYVLQIATAASAQKACHPHHVVQLAAGAEAQVVELQLAQTDQPYFRNAVLEVQLAEGAKLEHIQLQQNAEQATNVESIHIKQAAKSHYQFRGLGLGSLLSRHDIRSQLAGEQAYCGIDGVFVPRGRQHMDYHTLVDHQQPECISRELFKGIIDQRGRGVFNGRVLVREGAQLTDSEQASNNLLLSRDAEIDTKPELEIYADDVKCAHGATVGQLDEKALFYLRSRGISAARAEQLMTVAFAGDVLERVQDPELRKALKRCLLAKIPHDDALEDMV